MTARPLTSDDVVISAELQPHCNRYRVHSSLKGLSCVSWICFVARQEWETRQALQKAVIMLNLQRKLVMHFKACESYRMVDTGEVKVTVNRCYGVDSPEN